MKPLFVFLAICVFGCTVSRLPTRPTPTDTLAARDTIPPAIYAAFERGRYTDDMGMPVAFIGSLESVSSKPHMNVFGEEWSVVVTVKKILLGTWREKNLGFGVSRPDRVPLKPGLDYYIVASWGRHGMLIHATIPVVEEPNQSPEPTR